MGCSSGKEETGYGHHMFHKPQTTKNNFKIVLLGKSGVGKTSITLRYCRDTFQEGTEATIGASFLNKVVSLSDRQFKLDIWDTAGQERYRSLTPLYYRSADAGLLVYDLSDYESFGAIQSFYQELRQNVPNCVIFLVANKADIIPDRRFNKESALQWAKDKECPLVEVSSKTGENIQELFSQVVAQLSEKYPFQSTPLFHSLLFSII